MGLNRKRKTFAAVASTSATEDEMFVVVVVVNSFMKM